MSSIKRPLNLLMLGNTGAGKSSCGNTILSGDADKIIITFRSAAITNNRRTTIPKIVKKTVLGRDLQVIDTVGVLNNKDTKVAAQLKCVFKKEGVDAVLFVIQCQTRVGEISSKDLESLKYTNRLLGKEFWKYCIFIVTYGDTYEQYAKGGHCQVQANFEEEALTSKLATCDETVLGPWVDKANGGVVLFENTKTDPETRKEMVETLLGKVELLHKTNGGKQLQSINKSGCTIL